MGEPTIGYVGLGNAGYPMAACLAKKGHRLLVRDADPARGVKFVEEFPKCRIATSDAESFESCEVIITMLPNGSVVKDVLLGEIGIAPHLKPGMTFLSTILSHILT
jgi:3-hydroxyisobutyrate dehydrogenase-like beta-hydroxyacid dehydrogenase